MLLRVERHRIRMDEAMGDRRCKRQSQWSRRQNDWSGPGSGGGGSACLRQGTAILVIHVHILNSLRAEHSLFVARGDSIVVHMIVSL